MSETTLDPQRQEQARRYARQRRRLFLVDLALGAAYVLAWLLTGLSATLASRLETRFPSPWLSVGIYVILFLIGYGILNLPLGYYTGALLPRRYGLVTQSVWGWLADQAKAGALGLFFGLIALEGIYWLLRVAPAVWWLWAGVAYLGFTVVLANLAPILIAPLFYKFKPLADADLTERLIRLAERAGTRVRGVFTFNMSSKTTAANAALMGLGNTRRIVLGDTLLARYTPDEIESILAHELAHHVHRDVPLGIAVSVVQTLAGLWLVDVALRALASALGFRGPGDLAAFSLLAFILSVFGLVTMPLSNAYSRWRERMADAYALRATGNPHAFAGAMTKLANQNLAEAEPERWVEFFFYTHPPIGQRIRKAEEWKNQ
ncbi:MAG: M48 family metallopeptidase [Anaerolineae bacterium]|nr:M48 family metallopeptidase [Anaerolineae bacterium]